MDIKSIPICLNLKTKEDVFNLLSETKKKTGEYPNISFFPFMEKIFAQIYDVNYYFITDITRLDIDAFLKRERYYD
jgi:hypothetical protein